MASLVVAAAGAGIGAAIPGVGASIGWTIGSFIGSQLFAEGQDIQGPRLSDLKVQSSAYGKDIPIVYGTMRIAGNVIWSTPIRETAHEEEQGKGGSSSSVTTYTYDATFAVGLCEGPIIGIRRIWADAKLIYKMDEGVTLEEIMASNRAASGFTIYTGSQTQQPDPLIQADKGAANTQAFRGHAYVVFNRLQLKDYGNRIPNITVEVVASGSLEALGALDTFTVDVPRLQANNNYININKFDGDTFEVSIASGGDVDTIGIPTLSGLASFTINGAQTAFTSSDNTIGSSFPDRFDDVEGLMLNSFSDVLTPYRGSAQLCGIYNKTPVLQLGASGKISDSISVGNTGATTTKKLAYGYAKILWSFNGSSYSRGAILEGQDLTQLLIDYGAGDEYIYFTAGNRDDASDVQDFFYVFTRQTSNGSATKYYKFTLIGGSWSITEDGTCSVSNGVIGSGGCMEAGNAIAENENYVWLASVGGNYAAYLEKSGTTFTTNVLARDTSAAQNLPFCIAAKDGVMLTMTQNASVNDNYYRFNVLPFSRQQVLSPDGVTLSSIQQDICERAGLSASDIGVTGLTDTVTGYVIPRNMSARSASEPLQKAYFYDAAEISSKLAFVKRGGASVATITEGELGAHDYGSDYELITHDRMQDAELPSEVVVKFVDENRAYQDGAQRSQRINHTVENVVTIDLPIAMTATQGRQIAEKHMQNMFTERDRYTFSLSRDYLQRNPTNILTIPANDVSRDVRITKITYGPIIEIESVADSPAVYESSAVAGEGEAVDDAVGLEGPTKLHLLDIPILRNQDNGEGIYLAGAGYFDGWTGAQVFRSNDAENGFTPSTSIFNDAVMGYTTDTLGDASFYDWDRANTVNVRLTNGDLSSITEDGAVQGNNYCLIGSQANGWEVIQYVNATQEADGSYTLDTLLRGRRGTDWATGTHAAGDAFIFIGALTIKRLEHAYNSLYYYRAATFGTFLDEAVTQSITNTGVSLKPFSPYQLSFSLDGSNNLTGSWQSRSRYIATTFRDLPLFEASEEYEVDVVKAGVVQVTKTVTSKSLSYAAAQQVTDGLTAGDFDTIRVYQISEIVGRGYVAEFTL